MTDTVLSLLCKDQWKRNTYSTYAVNFKEDGTGELHCHDSGNHLLYIAAMTDWKATTPELLNQVIDIGVTSKTQLLAELEIQMTLTKREHPMFESFKWKKNEHYLIDDAFLPKTYNIRLEKGKFIAPLDRSDDGTIPYNMPTYTVRLVFDKSPYPMRHQWKDPEVADRAMCSRQWKVFHAGGISLPDDSLYTYKMHEMYSKGVRFWHSATGGVFKPRWS
ncbi:hypothetical protein FQN49_002998 [Arthroderma sp. PD_2]|nr:hypothetical protein FQN49_002998 [Arthroderma sp. PD_2]